MAEQGKNTTQTNQGLEKQPESPYSTVSFLTAFRELGQRAGSPAQRPGEPLAAPGQTNPASAA